jgi:hypothetical protein
MLYEPDEKVYSDTLSQEASQHLDELTQNRFWDSDDFKKVMIVLTSLGEGTYIPGYNRPESIHIQLMHDVIADIDQRTETTRREHCRPVYADIESQELVYGRVTIGSANTVRVDEQKQPGREMFQEMVGVIHSHPNIAEVIPNGFSGEDYSYLLTKPALQFVAMRWAKNTLIALKTSATPNALSSEDTNKRLHDLRNEFLSKRQPGMLTMLDLVEFNKAVCTEFGLTLYMATETTRDLVERVEVTK